MVKWLKGLNGSTSSSNLASMVSGKQITKRLIWYIVNLA